MRAYDLLQMASRFHSPDHRCFDTQAMAPLVVLGADLDIHFPPDGIREMAPDRSKDSPAQTPAHLPLVLPTPSLPHCTPRRYVEREV